MSYVGEVHEILQPGKSEKMYYPESSATYYVFIKQEKSQ